MLALQWMDMGINILQKVAGRYVKVKGCGQMCEGQRS